MFSDRFTPFHSRVHAIRGLSAGFTTLELVVVLVILGILGAVAAPYFVSLGADARVSVLTGISTSVRTANDLISAKSRLPSFSVQPVPGRVDLVDIDLDGDGVFETRLKWNYLDNTDIHKRVKLSSELLVRIDAIGVTDTFIGYDRNKNGTLEAADGCYFRYTQAASASQPPVYTIVSGGC